MLKRFLTVCIIGVLLTALPAFAGPTPPPQIISMSVTNVGTAFVGGIGGPLTMNGVGGINVEYSTGTVTYGSGPFSLNTTLATNTSIGGIASGTFTGGAFLYKDSGGTILLSGSIAFLNLTETYNGSGRFFGDGHLTITGGTLQPNFGATGDMVDISYSVNPKSISDFGYGFTASSDMTILPCIPEPATIALLTIGALISMKRKNIK